MPWIARVVAPDCPHHVTQRGNRRYTQRINERNAWTGYLWQMRFASSSLLKQIKKPLGRKLTKQKPGPKPKPRREIEMRDRYIFRAPGSWRDPVGESPVQIGRCVRLVASVAWWKATTIAKRTQQSAGNSVTVHF